jgi:hypothetical protein
VEVEAEITFPVSHKSQSAPPWRALLPTMYFFPFCFLKKLYIQPGGSAMVKALDHNRLNEKDDIV